MNCLIVNAVHLHASTNLMQIFKKKVGQSMNNIIHISNVDPFISTIQCIIYIARNLEICL